MGGSQNSLLKNSGAGNGAGNSSCGVATHKGPDEDKVRVQSSYKQGCQVGDFIANLAKLAKSGSPSAKFIFDTQVYLAKFQPLPANTAKYFLAIFDPVQALFGEIQALIWLSRFFGPGNLGVNLGSMF